LANNRCFSLSLALYFLACLLLAVVSIPQTQLAIGTSKSPYDSGYDHGCHDAGIPNASNRYINQPEKGPNFHTDQFMRGYYAGFAACSGGSSPDRTNAGETFAAGQSAGKLKGHNDAINGRTSDDRCGSGHSNDYCLGYKAGYNVEYQWTRFVQDKR
jgi:hypothetical protein